MTTTQKISALIKREFLDGKGGYLYTPLVIIAIIAGTSLISLILGNEPIRFDEFTMGEASEKWDNLGENGKEAIGYILSFMFLISSAALWIALPFVMFFSLLGTLYEDRRDKSILFWKSMPVSDATEVLVKFFTSTLMAMGIFFAAAIVLQLFTAIVLTIFFGIQGAPISVFWPVGQIIESWFVVIPSLLLVFLWTAPIFGWLIFVSSFSNRMPFMYAVVPIVVLAILEATMFESTQFIEAFAQHVAVGFAEGVEYTAQIMHAENGSIHLDIDNEESAAAMLASIDSFKVSNMYAYAFSQVKFWVGLLISGGFIYGAIEFRKRAA
ncbi:hypothetical protein QGN29_00355 [Temperatibacter marinus]|uniref:ABC-2 type transport system permease protein n=1 Tax=Temperatibacter marinus TaxID=1456591 RepID=A0AA52HAP3_9PROT|nr:hypothetical protein [Temperatibacter marinus]WND02813.1 hypothetical protein QGN29_00355 [Temperatibacter marinus]